jgi:hypothetical protein
MEQAIWRGRVAAAELVQPSHAEDVAELPTLDDVLADFARDVGLGSEAGQFAIERSREATD